MSGQRRSSKEPYSFETWCQVELSRLLKSQVGEELIQYLLSIVTRKDVEEYLADLLGNEGRRVENFYREFFRRWRPPQRQAGEPSLEETELLTPLVRTRDDDMVLFATEKGKQENSSKVNPPPGFSNEGTKAGASPPLTNPHQGNQKENTSIRGTNVQDFRTNQTELIGKHKQKFVPLLSAEGQSRATVQIPGRHTCQCLGQKHALVNNCVECGRIVCSQEGSGPCAFCGALVCTPEEEEILMRDSKKAQKYREKFFKQFQIRERDRALEHIQRSVGEGLDKAMEHKDKLIEFDQTSMNRTKVIDDEMDYFAVDSNRWLSKRERDALRSKEESLKEKRHESRRNKPITIDFAGRKIVEDSKKIDTYDERHALEALSGNRKERPADIVHTHAGGIYNPSIPIAPPKYQETHKERRRAKRQSSKKSELETEEEKGQIVRLQDRTLQEMTDDGKCLSMHQPWASLLVAGIKTCEGRSWYSTHRGRLWIAAAAKNTETEEIQKLEDFYRSFHKHEELTFPEDYPTSCLLGCVDMVDCLPQEEYREKFPGGESESAYVFVVENPQQLTVKFHVKGQHKIWKLEASVHAGAKKGLKPSLS